MRKGPTSFLTLMILSASTQVDYLIKKFSYHSCIVVYKFTAKVGTKKGEDKECPPARSFSEVFSEVSEVLLPKNPLKSSETSELSEVLKVNYLVFSKFKSREARVIQRFITPSPSHFSIGITSFPSLRGLPTESSEH